MIPRAHIQQWAAFAPWPDRRQVEQDLVISRALCDLFASDAIRDRIAFRGGTAIHKLLLTKPLRYSEDIDLVQTRAEPIGPVIDGVKDALSWLGRGKLSQAQRSTTLVFRFTPEEAGDQPLKSRLRSTRGSTRAGMGFTHIRSRSIATGIAQRSRSRRMTRRNCSPRNCGRCCSETRTGTCSTSMRPCFCPVLTAIGCSSASSVILSTKGMQSHGPWPRSGC